MTSPTYERVKNVVADIYEEHADIMGDFPLDVFELADRMGFKIITAKARVGNSWKKFFEYRRINREKKISGFSYFDGIEECYVIYIDDIDASSCRQRFSLAHEIGHIALGHIDKGDQDFDEAEKEANYFAGYLLCPDCIGVDEQIWEGIHQSPEILMNVFGISEDAARVRFRFINNRNKLAKQRLLGYEKTIMACIERPLRRLIQTKREQIRANANEEERISHPKISICAIENGFCEGERGGTRG